MALVVLALAGLAGALAGAGLEVRPGYVDLLDPSSPLQRRYLDLLAELGNVEPLVALVEAEDPAQAGAAADAFAARAASLRGKDGGLLVGSVVHRIDHAALLSRAPGFAPARLLDEMREDGCWERLARPEGPTAADLLGCLRGRLDAAVANASSGDSLPAGAEQLEASWLTGSLSALARVASGDAAPVASALMPGLRTDGTDADGRLQLAPGSLVVMVMPADASNDYRLMAVLLRQARAAADEAVAASEGAATIRFTGAPALVVDEMSAVTRDVALASVLSFALVTLLFLVSFNSLRHVAFAAIANAAGLALTFGAAWILVGYLNLFSSVFAAVLAGLGIDFGIHFLNFYEARRREGLAAGPALVASWTSVVPPIAVSAVTTAAAFLTVMTSEFAGFAQLGLISGVGVLLCLLTAFTLVPALLAWESRRRPSHPPGSREPWSLPLLMIPVRAAPVVAAASVILIVLAAFAARRLSFDHDLMNLQPEGSEALSLQKGAEGRVGTHPAYSLAATQAEARERAARFRALPSVATVQAPTDLLPPPDAERPRALQLLLDVALAARAPGAAAPVASDEGAAALQMASDEAGTLRERLVELQDLAFEAGSAEQVQALDAPIGAAAALAEALADPAAAGRLLALQAEARNVVSGILDALPRLASGGLGTDDLPDSLRGLVGRSGRLALVVMPREAVWDRPALLRFLAEIRTVDESITGPAVQVAEIPELMRRSLARASALALAVIVALVLATTRSVTTTLLSLVPLACGFVFMLGSMRVLGVPLNPANLIALPILLGIGVDGGVHLVHRWVATRDAARAVVDVGHALLITSLTTVAGFLPLLLARHRGIRSLGAATCLGSLGMLLAVVVVAPALLTMIDRFREARAPTRPS